MATTPPSDADPDERRQAPGLGGAAPAMPVVGDRRGAHARLLVTRSPRMPGRSEDEDQDEHRERDHVLELVGRRARRSRSGRASGPIASIRPRNRPPSMAPGMLPMPPRTAAVNALMPGKKPIAKVTWRERQAVQHAGRAGHRGADGERQDDRAVRVDAHQGRRVLVLRDGPDRGAGLGPHHEQVQAGHHGERGDDHEHVHPAHAEERDREPARCRNVDGRVGVDARSRRSRGTVYCRKNDAPMALISGTRRGGVPQRPVGDPLDAARRAATETAIATRIMMTIAIRLVERRCRSGSPAWASATAAK